MADYLYLLQYRLTPAQRKALETVRDAARERGAPVFLVGGAVRDLTSGLPVRDLDFAVQGDVAALRPAFEQAGATLAGEDAIFGSQYLLFPGGVRVEVGPALTVTYPKVNEPEVKAASILDDLRRRDFTSNAMAISLNQGSYGLLLDPLNGIADLENRELRLVSPLGFVEQPALLIRAARLSQRLGWSLEQRTRQRYENAKEDGSIERLPAAARGYELGEVFLEEDPAAAVEHLQAEGWLEALHPALATLKFDNEAIDRVRDAAGQLEQLGIHSDPAPVIFQLLTAKLPGETTASLKAALARQGFVQQVETLDARSRELAAQLNSKAAAAPSAAWKILFAAEPEVLLALVTATRSGALHAKLRAFLHDWPQVRQRIPYAQMQEMRITPDLPGYADLLDELFFALLDGKLGTAEEMRAFLEPYSPPAPAQQAPPRRRAAKATRGRGRQAAAPAVQEPNGEPADGDVAAAEAPPAVKEPIPAKPEPPSAPSAAKVQGGKELVKPAETAKRPAKKETPVAAAVPVPVQTPKAAPSKVAQTQPEKGTSPAKAAAKVGGKPASVSEKPATKDVSKAGAAASKGSPLKVPAKAPKASLSTSPAKAAPATGKTVGGKSAKTPAKVVVVAKKAATAVTGQKSVVKAPGKAISSKKSGVSATKKTAPAKRGR